MVEGTLHVGENAVLVHAHNGKQAFVNLSAFGNFLFSVPTRRIVSGSGQVQSVC